MEHHQYNNMSSHLKQFANSGMWDVVKEELFEVELDKIRDVRNNLGDIPAKDAYRAKILASKAIENIIKTIDLLKNSSGSNKAINYE